MPSVPPQMAPQEGWCISTMKGCSYNFFTPFNMLIEELPACQANKIKSDAAIWFRKILIFTLLFMLATLVNHFVFHTLAMNAQTVGLLVNILVWLYAFFLVLASYH